MSEYTPDKWVIVDYGNEYPDTQRYAVLAGWYGGFAGSNSWKRSSPVVKFGIGDNKIRAYTESGSIYHLHCWAIGVTMVTSSLIHAASLEVLEELEDIFSVIKGFKNG